MVTEEKSFACWRNVWVRLHDAARACSNGNTPRKRMNQCSSVMDDSKMHYGMCILKKWQKRVKQKTGGITAQPLQRL